MLDQFLETLSNLSVLLLPVVGVVVLIFLILFLRKLIQFINDLKVTVEKVNKTIDTVDTSIEKLQAPLSTLTNITGTVDSIYSSTMKVSNTFFNIILENLDTLKKWFSQHFQKKKETTDNIASGVDSVMEEPIVNDQVMEEEEMDYE